MTEVIMINTLMLIINVIMLAINSHFIKQGLSSDDY